MFPMKTSPTELRFSLILGIVAGLIMVVTGVLTAMQITPPIAATGAEVGLGIWRVLAGVLVLIFSFVMVKQRAMAAIVLVLGLFEILVFAVEKDYTLLIAGPIIAILAGILAFAKR